MCIRDSWCITYIATITYGAVIVPILQDFTPADIIHIINHSESRMLFLGDNFWDNIEEEQIRQIEAVFSLTDFHTIYERDGKALTKFQRDILKNYRSKYPRDVYKRQGPFPAEVTRLQTGRKTERPDSD